MKMSFWFIDFKGMSTCLELFYTQRLRNHIWIYIFLKKLSFPPLRHSQIYLTLIDETLTSTTTLNQSGPGSNGNERVVHTPTDLEPHHQILFSVQSKTPLFFGGWRVGLTPL